MTIGRFNSSNHAALRCNTAILQRPGNHGQTWHHGDHAFMELIVPARPRMQHGSRRFAPATQRAGDCRR